MYIKKYMRVFDLIKYIYMTKYSFILESNIKKLTIQELVKDPEWQKLRQSMVGTWKKTPEKNCMMLRGYLKDISKSPTNKLRIVKNYLTGSGFRIGIIQHHCIDKLKAEINEELNKRKV